MLGFAEINETFAGVGKGLYVGARRETREAINLSAPGIARPGRSD